MTKKEFFNKQNDNFNSDKTIDYSKRYEISNSITMSDIQLTFAYYDFIRDYFDFQQTIFDTEFSINSFKESNISNADTIVFNMVDFFAKRVWFSLVRMTQYKDPDKYCDLFDSVNDIQTWRKFIKQVLEQEKQTVNLLDLINKTLQLLKSISAEDTNKDKFQPVFDHINAISVRYYKLLKALHETQNDYNDYLLKLTKQFRGLKFS